MKGAPRAVRPQPDQRDSDQGVADRAFLDALHEHLDRLHNLARGLAGSLEDAEDLLQETCLLALHGWRQSPPDSPGTWLGTVCLHAARRARHGRPARPAGSPGDDGLPDEGGAHPPRVDPAARRVREALERLPDVQREAITLMDLGGCTAEQVGSIVGAPRAVVLSRVHRGRRALAALLDDWEVGGGPRPGG